MAEAVPADTGAMEEPIEPHTECGRPWE